MKATITLLYSARDAECKCELQLPLTIEHFLVSESISPTSFAVQINEDEVTDLSRQIQDGDIICIAPKTIRGAWTAKCCGRTYRLHMFDRDTIISDWHCHDMENGDRVDLHTGHVYEKTSKDPYKTLPRKCLDRLRDIFPKRR